MKPRIVFMGAGAIGGYVGGHLAPRRPRRDPDRPLARACRGDARPRPAARRLTDEENVTAQPKMHAPDRSAVSRKQRPIDIAFISMKSYDTEWATTMIRQYLAPGGFVVSLQNCINEERIAGIVGWGRTVGCIAAIISVDTVRARA